MTYVTLRKWSLALGAMAALAMIPAASFGAEAEKKNDTSEADLEKKLEAAQGRLNDAAREVAEISTKLSGEYAPYAMAYAASMNRAILGVAVGRGDRDEGVEVMSVTPGGPAADAGLKGGDVLLQVNGKTLKRDGSDAPYKQLLTSMQGVQPGQKVNVSY